MQSDERDIMNHTTKQNELADQDKNGDNEPKGWHCIVNPPLVSMVQIIYTMPTRDV